MSPTLLLRFFSNKPHVSDMQGINNGAVVNNKETLIIAHNLLLLNVSKMTLSDSVRFGDGT